MWCSSIKLCYRQRKQRLLRFNNNLGDDHLHLREGSVPYRLRVLSSVSQCKGRLKSKEGEVCGPAVGGDTSFEGFRWGEDEAATFSGLARQVRRRRWS